MDARQKLDSRLKQLAQLIQEAEDRLGAHSVKPLLMQQLFALEEERDAILNQRKELDNEARGS